LMTQRITSIFRFYFHHFICRIRNLIMWIDKHSAQYVPLQYNPKFWYMEMQVFNSEGDSATLVLVSEKDINLHGVLSCSLTTTVTSSFKYVQFSWKVAMLCKFFTVPVSVEVKHFLIMQYFLYQHVQFWWLVSSAFLGMCYTCTFPMFNVHLQPELILS
jgi:hypothetical protein